jgi:hypothetical protein
MVIADEYEGAIVEVSCSESIMDIHNARVSECFPVLHRPNRFFVGQTETWLCLSHCMITRDLHSLPSIRRRAKNLPFVLD